MPAAIGPERKTLGEAGAQLAIALSEFARLVEADTDDQLARGEEVVERLRRASLHVHEHMAVTVPSQELNARNVELIESCLEEGLPVVLSAGRSDHHCEERRGG
jgi:sialic acid synthase SpsE